MLLPMWLERERLLFSYSGCCITTNIFHKLRKSNYLAFLISVFFELAADDNRILENGFAGSADDGAAPQFDFDSQDFRFCICSFHNYFVY